MASLSFLSVTLTQVNAIHRFEAQRLLAAVVTPSKPSVKEEGVGEIVEPASFHWENS